jgi:hypothetical protein
LGDRGLGSIGALGPSGLDGQQIRFLQTLQRQYGNEHVARVVGLLRERAPAASPPLSVIDARGQTASLEMLAEIRTTVLEEVNAALTQEGLPTLPPNRVGVLTYPTDRPVKS